MSPLKSVQVSKGAMHTLGPRQAQEKSPLQREGTVTQWASGPVSRSMAAQTMPAFMQLMQWLAERHCAASTQSPV